MVAQLLLAVALLAQGGAPARDPVQALPPRIRAMVPLFPPPARGDVSVGLRFSTDTVFIGEQVEIVTATWIAGDLLSALRRMPRLSFPSLTGGWSTQSSTLPNLTMQRVVNGRVFNLYLSHQTIFPINAEVIDAPPARLEFWVPTSSSFFAPEEAKVILSPAARLVVLPVPANLASALDGGPTARGLAMFWRGPASGLKAGVPAPLELVIRGSGNVTLWPEPEIAWPGNVHVYPEPSEESRQQGTELNSGEKRFRFSVVVDSLGVLALPAIRYPYFDAAARDVRVAIASAFALPVLPAGAPTTAREPPRISASPRVPVASLVVDRGGALLWFAALLPVGLLLWSRRDVRRKRPSVVTAAADPEEELRRLLGTPVDAGPERVTVALRQRGIPRQDAEAVRQWLVAAARKRYGPAATGTLPSTEVLLRVLARLRGPGRIALLALAVVLHGAQAQAGGIERYRSGDYLGAAREFEAAVEVHPLAPAVWRSLAAARMQIGDDVGSVAALSRALALAPRDPGARAMWQGLPVLPPDVRQLVPTVPLSRDELFLLALAAWILAVLAWALRRRRMAAAPALVAALALVIALSRWVETRHPRVLLRAGTVLRVSPTESAPRFGDLPEWTRARVERRTAGWYLVRTDRGAAGWIPVTSGAALGSLPRVEDL